MFCGYFVHIEDDTFIDVRYWCECNIRKPPNQAYSPPKKVICSDPGWFRVGPNCCGARRAEFLRYNASDIMLIPAARRDAMELKIQTDRFC